MIVVAACACHAMENSTDTLALLKEHIQSLPAPEQIECLSRLAQPQLPLPALESNGIMWSHTYALPESAPITTNQDEDEACLTHTKSYGLKTFFASLKAFIQSMCCKN